MPVADHLHDMGRCIATIAAFPGGCLLQTILDIHVQGDAEIMK